MSREDLIVKVQTHALNTWLVDYPSEWTYWQIIELLDDDNFAECNTQWRKVIVPTVVAQDCAGKVLAAYIQTAFKRAMGLIGEVQRG